MRLRSVRNRLAGLLLRRRTLPNPANDTKLRALRDVHRGRRAFVIGNGPSLTAADLDLIAGEISFASNKIYLIYEQTSWRPTYFTVTDEIVARDHAGALLAQPQTKVFGHATFQHFREREDIVFCNPARGSKRAKNWDLLDGVSTGHSVVYWDLELAFWMGIREVYALGMDFSFDVRSTPSRESSMGNQVIIAQGEQNHFHPDYRQAGERWTLPKLDRQREEFAFAHAKYSATGGAIVNVSRSTKLDVWPCSTLEDVL